MGSTGGRVGSGRASYAHERMPASTCASRSCRASSSACMQHATCGLPLPHVQGSSGSMFVAGSMRRQCNLDTAPRGRPRRPSADPRRRARSADQGRVQRRYEDRGTAQQMLFDRRPIPRVRSRIPRVRSRIPRVRFTDPRVLSRIPRVLSRIPRVRIRIPRVLSRIPRVRYHGSRVSVYGSRVSVYGSRVSVHGSRVSVHGSRVSVHGSRVSVSRIPRVRSRIPRVRSNAAPRCTRIIMESRCKSRRSIASSSSRARA